MRRVLFLFGLVVTTAQAADPLSPTEASNLLQSIAEASNHFAYQGIFVHQHGDMMQTFQVSSHPVPGGRESRLVDMDGEKREVRCSRDESVTIVGGGSSPRMIKRMGSRHFPDLLPADATSLVAWYNVRPVGMSRVAGLECRQLALEPKDQFRWGYVLCIDTETSLPLRALLVDSHGKPLMQYTFAELHIAAPTSGKAFMPKAPNPASSQTVEAPRMIETGAVEAKQLPPGFSRIAAVKRLLPRQGVEVEHWVFSDGLTHVSMFVEPLSRPDVSLKGASRRGMTNLLTRRVGQYQITVLGDAPWPTVNMIARGVEPSSP